MSIYKNGQKVLGSFNDVTGFVKKSDLETKTLTLAELGNFAGTVSAVNIEIKNGTVYFDFNVAKYSYPENIPLYKLQNHHYYFDFVETKVSKWDSECIISEKTDLVLNNFIGSISNIKLFDVYNDNVSEILMQYPNNKHLLINDTVRPLVGLDGVIRNS